MRVYAKPEKVPVLMTDPGPLTREEIQARSEGRGLEGMEAMKSLDEALENGFVMEVPGRLGILCPTLLGVMVTRVDWGQPN